MSHSNQPRQLHLGLFLFSTGYHPAGWRLPESVTDGAFDPKFLQGVAQRLEAAKFDFFFLETRWHPVRICSINSRPRWLGWSHSP